MLSQTVDGAKLRSLREAARMSVAALAEQAKCSRWHIYGIETGRWQCSGEVYDLIKEALDADDDDLLEEGDAA
ncbi:helix-turn-helix transcriptional regulator [Nocardiopsis tropica]|uniref:Helix-turn-helix transcriptional regulator n=1 Tax=Nocardiopsis tropica TaxID=109330 RepID=A0ABU7KR27_9ACTN|nr:helix-turn-helix transcriptional regulator [Nocardiopsis umidischolae]MEE2051753.1 helix-turn-helix transcriptional regulator [Nocardiopsis umidischolae]